MQGKLPFELPSLLLGLGFASFAQVLIWFQTHLHFFSSWAKDNPLCLALPGVLTSYCAIGSTRAFSAAFGGLAWPARLLGFSIGIIIFSLLSWIILHEPLTIKSGLCLSLAILILLIQIFV